MAGSLLFFNFKTERYSYHPIVFMHFSNPIRNSMMLPSPFARKQGSLNRNIASPVSRGARG